MKAHLIEIGLQKEQFFFIKKIEDHHFSGPFHFHDLCELNYVVHSYGKRVVGDNISNFSSGDMVLMSPNLPHIWYNDPSYFRTGQSQPAEAIVTYFNPTFLSRLMGDASGAEKVNDLLQRSKRGLRFTGNAHRQVSAKLSELMHKDGLKRVIDFLDILHILLHTNEYEYLASVGYQHSFNERDTKRMNTVYQYLMQNFTEPISLAEIAGIANLTPPAFCSFFKKRTQKSFSQFLNELRVGHACKLLQNPELSISDVGFQSGYHNMTNFNKFFKQITSKTPSRYRREFTEALRNTDDSQNKNAFPSHSPAGY